MTSTIGGFKDRSIENRTKVEPVTEQYIGKYRTGLDTVSQCFYENIGSDTVEAGSTTSIINATAHIARVGDVIKFTSGTLQYDFAFVQSVTTNSITLSQSLSGIPAALDSFNILRPALPVVDSSGVSAVGIYPPADSIVTSVTASIASVTLLAANVNRKGVIIRNDSTAILFVRLATGSATSSEPIRLDNNDVFILENGDYTGIISGIWSVATGNARVVELT